MKKQVLLLSSIMAMAASTMAQNCSELFITEIYVGENIAEEGVKNAAFELFNPTEKMLI